jgi:nucleolar protein 56
LEIPTIYETEFGYIVLREGRPSKGYKTLEELLSSEKFEEVYVSSESLMEKLASLSIRSRVASSSEVEMLDSKKLELLVESGLFKSYDEALEAVREKSIWKAEQEVREQSSRPDLHLSNAVQALDEIDRFLNILATRVKEWYGLHFPEIEGIVQDNITLCKFVGKFGRRENIDEKGLKELGFSEKKINAIIVAKENSKGGSISEIDEGRIKSLASISLSLSKERERLSEYVDRQMEEIAPNVKSITGSTIGARLIAKAGGLQRLASMPSSTIQILGAEKALFRALRTGGRPPKHGILFQHQEVHGAPKWQRGKIARAIANKVAIASRIDTYGSGLSPELVSSLKKSISRIKEIYSKPKQREKENGKNKNSKGRRKR